MRIQNLVTSAFAGCALALALSTQAFADLGGCSPSGQDPCGGGGEVLEAHGCSTLDDGTCCQYNTFRCVGTNTLWTDRYTVSHPCTQYPPPTGYQCFPPDG